MSNLFVAKRGEIRIKNSYENTVEIHMKMQCKIRKKQAKKFV